MPVARYKDLCIDSSASADGSDATAGRSPEALGRFWAAALGLSFEPDEAAGSVVGDESAKRIWVNVVPEPKAAKHRVHIDVHCASVDDLTALGATVLESAEEFNRHWTVMADPEGGEFCAFVRAPDALPDYRFYELVVDCLDPRTVAGWWADVLGARLGGNPDKGWYWLEETPGLPFRGWVFVTVPESKTAKNRVHWDVTMLADDGVAAFANAGALTLREPTPDCPWWVMADPEGNEFCAFAKRT